MNASEDSASADEFPPFDSHPGLTSSRAPAMAAGDDSSPLPAVDFCVHGRASVDALAEWPLDAPQPARPSHSPRAETAGPAPFYPAGPAFSVGGEVGGASHGARPSFGPPPRREIGGGGLALSEAVLAVLLVVAAHDELTPEGWVARAVMRRADAIGLGPLVDRMQDGPDGAARHGNFAARHCRDFGEGEDDG